MAFQSLTVCVPVSHLAQTSGFSLCLSYFMVLEELPRHSPHERVSCPFSCASAGRTLLHGTSQLLFEGSFSLIRNLESIYSDFSLTISRATTQEKAWVTRNFSSLAVLLLLCPTPTHLKFYKLMTVCMCSANEQKTWKEFLDFSPPVCLVD